MNYTLSTSTLTPTITLTPILTLTPTQIFSARAFRCRLSPDGKRAQKSALSGRAAQPQNDSTHPCNCGETA